MPRNASGQYSPPVGTYGTPGATIESSKYNAFVDDISADLNANRWGFAVFSGNAVYKTTKALLDADLAHDADTTGIVYQDATVANIGVYTKSGASGSGSWIQVLNYIPGNQVVTAVDDGSSTANAYTMNAEPYVSGTSQIIMFDVPVTNTSTAVTVTFDSGATLTVVTSTGDAPPIGGLVAGMSIWGKVSSSNFVITSDINSAAYQIAAAAEADRAEAAQAAAEDAQAAAEDAAASLDLPIISAGDAGKILVVKTDETGFDFKFGKTYLDVRDAGVSPSQTDNSARIQALVDANRYATIVIPDFDGADLPLEGEIFCEHDIEIFNRARLVRKAANGFQKTAMFAVRKRASGSVNAGAFGKIRFEGINAFFEPSHTLTVTPSAAQTIIPFSSSADDKFDIVMYRKTSGGVVIPMTVVSDLVSANSTQVVLTVAANGTDTYYFACMDASARNAVIGIEGTAAQPVDHVEIEDITIDGLPYVGVQAQYVERLKVNNVKSFGCIDRATVYPYLGVGEVIITNVTGDARPRSGWGAGEWECYYGFNVNDSVSGDVRPSGEEGISRLIFTDFVLRNYQSQGIHLSGDVNDALVSGGMIENSGVYSILTSDGGGTADRLRFSDIQCRYDAGLTAKGVQAVYIRTDRTSLANIDIIGAHQTGLYIWDGDGAGRLDDVTASNVRVKSCGLNGSATAVLLTNIDNSNLDITVENSGAIGVLATGITQSNLNIVARDSTGGGILSTGMQRCDARLTAIDNGGLGVDIYGTSTGNKIDAMTNGNGSIGFRLQASASKNMAEIASQNNTVQGVFLQGDNNVLNVNSQDNGSIGVQIQSGADNNIVSGLSLGNTSSQLSNSGTNNRVSELKIT